MAAGSSWPFSRQIAFDRNGNPSAGATAKFYAAGTTTALTVYADAAAAQPLTWPVVADQTGRFPRVFVPWGDYDELVVTGDGVELWYDQHISNPAPVDPSAAVDTTTIAQTGDIKPISGAVTQNGWVRCNGKTIGNASSGASERANADTASLFAFLWNNHADSICPVSTGRGSSASADFSAGKTITLLDVRGATLAGLDDMGNSAAGRFAGVPVTTGGATTAGATLGENTHLLSTAEIPAHGHPATATSTSTSTPSLSASSTTTGVTDFQGDHNHIQYTATAGTVAVTAGGGSTATANFNGTGALAVGTANAGSHQHNLVASTTTSISGTVSTTTTTAVTVNNNTGGGGAHNTVQRTVLVTFLQKL